MAMTQSARFRNCGMRHVAIPKFSKFLKFNKCQFAKNPQLPPLDPPRRRMGVGDAILVFNTEKVDEHCEAAAKLPGVFMTTEASNTTYPARAGGEPIVVRTCYLFDRDGYFMELNKVLDRESYNKGQ